MRSAFVLSALVCYIAMVLLAIPVAVTSSAGFATAFALGGGLALGVSGLVWIIRSIIEDGFW